MGHFVHDELLWKALLKMHCSLVTMNHQINILSGRLNSLAVTGMGQGRPQQLEDNFLNLALEISEIEQYSFATDVEIYHLVERDNEECEDVALFIAAKLGVTVKRRDIVLAHRFGRYRRGAGAERARPLYVRFTLRSIRNAILAAARVNPGERPFKIYERMTARNRDLFHRAWKLTRAKQFKYLWCKNGKIYTRKDDGRAKMRIRHTDDLNALFDLYENRG